MSYDPRHLERLAHNPAFVAQVRKLAGALIIAGPQLTPQILPVCHYGPERPATLLRLGPHLKINGRCRLDGHLAAALVDVQEALAEAELS